MKTKKNKLVSFEDHLDNQYGKRGSGKRERFEMEAEAFGLGVTIKSIREQKHLTQEQLAAKCGTTKAYISRIENNASDIRLSTLMRILYDGLGARLNFEIKV